MREREDDCRRRDELLGRRGWTIGDLEPDKEMRPDADEDPTLKVYHAFSRIHGDLERDYNNFVIEPSYWSQGPGNFRDVNQNRRCDVMQLPAVHDFNIRQFLSYIQHDGYNIVGSRWRRTRSPDPAHSSL